MWYSIWHYENVTCTQWPFSVLWSINPLPPGILLWWTPLSLDPFLHRAQTSGSYFVMVPAHLLMLFYHPGAGWVLVYHPDHKFPLGTNCIFISFVSPPRICMFLLQKWDMLSLKSYTWWKKSIKYGVNILSLSQAQGTWVSSFICILLDFFHHIFLSLKLPSLQRTYIFPQASPGPPGAALHLDIWIYSSLFHTFL